jgi:hypothetical protein
MKKTAIAGVLVLALLGAVLTAATAFGDTGSASVSWTGNGVVGGVGGSRCDTQNGDLLDPVPDGQKGWLFVLQQVSGDTSVWRLDVTFSSGSPQIGLVPVQTLSKVVKWAVYSDAGASLLSATAYSGDPNNTSTGQLVISHCATGSPTQAQPSLTTTAQPGGFAGDTLSDTAHLKDGNNPSGTITFQLFGPGDDQCSTPLYTDTVNVNGNGDYSSDNNGTPPGGNVATKSGTYQWVATYSGDTNNFGAGTECNDPDEASVIEAAAPTVLTSIHLDPETSPPTVVTTDLPLGSSVHDSGSVSGPAILGTPTGYVTFDFYKGSCDDKNPVLISTTPLPGVLLNANGVADPSQSSGALGAGKYFFVAHFISTDTNVWQNSDGTCEPLTIDKANTTSKTTEVRNDTNASLPATGGHVPLGTTVHDTATVGDQVTGFDLTGTLTYHFYTGLDCNPKNEVVSSPADTTNVSATGTAGSSAPHGPLAAGDYSFNAEYSGNSNYNGSGLSACEPFTVDQASTTVRTSVVREDTGGTVAVGGNVPAGTSVHDTATVGTQVGTFVITGTVTYHFFASIDCKSNEFIGGSPKWPQDVTISGGAVPNSQSTGPLPGGSYGFQAVYQGDSNYKGSTGACEPFTERTFGYTMGFWGNRNGQALLASVHAFSSPVVLGGASPLCNITVNSAAISLTIFPNTLNGMSILTNCNSSNKVELNLNTQSINVLIAQTLALSYNILYKSHFTGQTIGGMGCTAVGTLTSTSTVSDARDYGNYLIANLVKGGTLVTQTQIGDFNTLAGCLNTESA